MKKGIILCLFLTLIAAQGDFLWFNGTNNRISYASGGTNYLTGSAFDSSIGCYVQLIYAGNNDAIDPAVASGDGTSGDDEVHDRAWMGSGYFTSPYNGRVNGGLLSHATYLGNYYVRAWAASAADYAAGVIPIHPTNYYGNSIMYQDQGTNLIEPPDFDFGGPTGFSTVLKPLVVDSDTNGLPDWWEYTYFKVFTNTDPWADADTDTVANLHEYYAGTDPTNAWSFLAIDEIGMNGSSGRVLRWPAESRQLYSLERGTNDSTAGHQAFSFAQVTNNLQTADGWLSFTDRVEGAGPYFYRVTTTVFTNW